MKNLNYENIIKRKIGYAITNTISHVAHFSEDKEKEIIVWLRLQQNLDKQQYIEFIIDKFNTTEKDAEKVYYKAFPDGIDLIVEKNDLNMITEYLKNIQINDISSILDDSIKIIEKGDFDENSPDIILALASMLKRRKVI